MLIHNYPFLIWKKIIINRGIRYLIYLIIYIVLKTILMYDRLALLDELINVEESCGSTCSIAVACHYKFYNISAAGSLGVHIVLICLV